MTRTLGKEYIDNVEGVPVRVIYALDPSGNLVAIACDEDGNQSTVISGSVAVTNADIGDIKGDIALIKAKLPALTADGNIATEEQLPDRDMGEYKVFCEAQVINSGAAAASTYSIANPGWKEFTVFIKVAGNTASVTTNVKGKPFSDADYYSASADLAAVVGGASATCVRFKVYDDSPFLQLYFTVSTQNATITAYAYGRP